MLNLVVNARDAVSVRDGRITVSTRNVTRDAVMGAIDARPQVIRCDRRRANICSCDARN
jgi:nitrogen-specific signal transduction histidine kinase